ncbi:thermonuclease family protein [Methanohalophilus halophilus]|uniref:Nuclease n=1 Tax=Methanohalophilus halophilus TaxID=2177 RepID=A0A1L3Q1P7_9EURY|nr:thermonuclease family protein [Methanohalophilus halophilus]APH38794.1 nuclease [Methanohalophilus halophilus]RNI07988.1 thermonuclease family protein [Methanohalophilus halophilus]SDW72313.1 micrococcal nuclease [Methanohalophilus halophilus]
MFKKTLIFVVALLILLSSGCLSSDENQIVNSTTTVVRVIDGDTFVMDSGEKVRLIGVDTPELDEPYYTEAKDYLSNRIEGKQVLLEGDSSNRDTYGRLLRYVWLDGELVNRELVEEGLALSRAYEPDTKYQHIFAEAQQNARDAKLGIWSYSKNNNTAVISYLEAGNHIGEVKTVEGRVVSTAKNEEDGIIYLNFHEPYEGYFTVIIWQDSWSNFPQSPDIYYEGKDVLVTGKVKDYKGTPEIEISGVSQIEIVG